MAVLGLCCCQGFSLVSGNDRGLLSNCGGLSSFGSWALEHKHSNRGMWDLPRSGIEPVSPPLASRFPSTVPLGKPTAGYFLEERV